MDKLNALAVELGWIDRLNRAYAYTNPPKPRRRRRMIIIILFAFVLGMGCASTIFWWDSLSTFFSEIGNYFT